MDCVRLQILLVGFIGRAPALGPVGIAFDAEGPAGATGAVGETISAAGNAAVGEGRATGGLLLLVLSIGRFGAAPQSGRSERSPPKDPRPPRPRYEPRDDETYPRGPAGGPELSPRVRDA